MCNSGFRRSTIAAIRDVGSDLMTAYANSATLVLDKYLMGYWPDARDVRVIRFNVTEGE